MNIAELGRKSKEWAARIPTDTLYVVALVLACVVSFELGVLTQREEGQGGGFSIEYPEGMTAAVAAAPITQGEGKYVASKKGTKYHLPTCAGAKTISEENKVWFASKEDAEAQGYGPAGNCKGI